MRKKMISNNVKRTAVVLTAMALAFSNMPTHMLSQNTASVQADVVATSGKCGVNLTWNLNKTGTLTISGTGEMYSWSDSSKVPWKKSADSIKKIEVKEGVTSIGESAFFSCENATSLTLPDSLITIKNALPQEDMKMKTIRIPKNVKEMSLHNFLWYDEGPEERCLENIEVDEQNKVYSSVDGVLFNKDKTVLLVYPNGKKDKRYSVPAGVKEIGDYAFSQCWELNCITMPEGVTKIGDYAFNYTNLCSVRMPDSVKEIGECIFYGYRTVGNFFVPKGMNSLHRIVCSDTESSHDLEHLYIPSSVKNIDLSALIIHGEDPETTFFDSFTLYGKLGSYAHKFASKYSMKFVEYNGPVNKVMADSPFLVSGVENGGAYNYYGVRIKVDCGDVKSITLDGKPFECGDYVKKQGKHKLVVTDTHGKKKVIKFKIDRKKPKCSKSATTSSTGGLLLALIRALLLLAHKGGIASTVTGPL